MSKRGVNLVELTLPQTAQMEATMLIWNTGRGIRGGLKHPGHASVLLRRSMQQGPWMADIFGATEVVDEHEPTEARHVSFWPAGGGGTKIIDMGVAGSTTKGGNKGTYLGRRDATFLRHHLADFVGELGDHAREALEGGGAPRPGQVVIGRRDGDDAWGQKPQAEITIPGMTGSRVRGLGVDLRKIVAWCNAFARGPEFNYTYISTSQNCSGVAARALAAGGADPFARLGGGSRKATLYFTPNDAQRWGESVARGIQRANDMLDSFRNNPAVPALPPGTDLMTAAQWRETSTYDRPIPGQVIRKVEAALRLYHAAAWNTDLPGKLEAMLNAMVAVHEVLRNPGRHAAACLRLAGDVRAVVRERGISCDAPWSPQTFAP
jgi:hypothetical protein